VNLLLICREAVLLGGTIAKSGNKALTESYMYSDLYNRNMKMQAF
jgi:hypothetical protein